MMPEKYKTNEKSERPEEEDAQILARRIDELLTVAQSRGQRPNREMVRF